MLQVSVIARIRVGLVCLVTLAGLVTSAGLAAAEPPPKLELDTTIERDEGFVAGQIEVSAKRPVTLTGVVLDDVLEAKFPPGADPGLEPGSTPGWFEIAYVEVEVDTQIVVDGVMLLPFRYDLCRAAPHDGAVALRNVATLEASSGDGMVELLDRTGFELFDPQCPDVVASFVDQHGDPVAGVTLTLDGGADALECVAGVDGQCLLEDLPVGTYDIDVSTLPRGHLFDGCFSGAVEVTEVELTHGNDLALDCLVERRFGAGSCIGDGACVGLTGLVGDGSCVGDEACAFSSAVIGDGACLGSRACHTAGGTVGDGACLGEQACEDSLADVALGACDGIGACQLASGSIQSGSCIGDRACAEATAEVGIEACQGEFACSFAAGPVGDGSCVGSEACFAVGGEVGSGSCLGLRACHSAAGPIGDGSCIGDFACEDITEPIGDGTCIGYQACRGV